MSPRPTLREILEWYCREAQARGLTPDEEQIKTALEHPVRAGHGDRRPIGVCAWTRDGLADEAQDLDGEAVAGLREMAKKYGQRAEDGDSVWLDGDDVDWLQVSLEGE